MVQRPLTGIRILETGHAYAIPWATRLLADLGADVLKVESHTYMYNLRGAGPYPLEDPRVADDYWNRAGFVHEVNRNKRGITLDLTKPRGRELFRALVAQVDVVAENFAPRVMRNFGLDYASLRQVKPDLIMVSSSGFGHTGPYADYTAWGNTLEPMSGISHVTGYPDGPRPSPQTYTDVPAAYIAAFAILMALRHRRRTGEGQYIDVSQYEIGIHMIPQVPLDYEMNGRITGRMGNHHQSMAPHGVYPCQGYDRHVTIAVPDDATWARLAAAIGRPEWAADPRYADALSRKHHEDELDQALAAWTKERAAEDIVRQLQAAGVPCGLVMNARDLLLDEHLRARNAFPRLRHEPPVDSMGVRIYPGPPWKLSATPPVMGRQAPALGEHTREVLRDLLGLSDADIEQLQAEGVIGSVPVGSGMRHDYSSTSFVLRKAEVDRLRGGLSPLQDANYRELLGLDEGISAS